MTEPSLYNHFIKRMHISRTCLMATRPRWKGSLWQEPFVPSRIPQQFLRSFPSLPDTEGPRKSPCGFQLEWRIMGSGMAVGEGSELCSSSAPAGALHSQWPRPSRESQPGLWQRCHTWGHWDSFSQSLYFSGLSVMAVYHNSIWFIQYFIICYFCQLRFDVVFHLLFNLSATFCFLCVALKNPFSNLIFHPQKIRLQGHGYVQLGLAIILTRTGI